MSDLLNQASLVMVPSGYKEDTVYSVVPSDGSGDLSFTRASNGTRVNSAGLVEVVPWNLCTYSEDFNADWIGGGLGKPTMTNNFAEAPNGTITASKMEAASDGYQLRQNNAQENTQMNLSVWLRTNTGTKTIQLFLNNASTASQNITVTTTWTRYEISGLVTTLSGGGRNGLNTLEALTSSNYILVWGFQLSVGLTAKPYFPTTDRLNVPRLTYQNGGGGCPSLLLEKQSTNLVTYSEQFDNAAWTKSNSTITANSVTSPDGTQNADTITDNTTNGAHVVYQIPSGQSVGTAWTCYMKKGSLNYGYISAVQSTTHFTTAIINLNDGSIVELQNGSSTTGTVTTEDCGNGWYRVKMQTNANGSGIGVGTSNGSPLSGTYKEAIYTGTGSGTIYLWGAQLEDSTYATSYIPTTSSSATRVADYVSRSGLALTNSTFAVNFKPLDYVVELFDFEKTGGGRMFYIAVQSNGYITFNSVSGGTIGAIGSILPKNQTCKLAFTLNASTSNLTVFINGSKIGTYATNITTFGAFMGLQSFGYNPGTQIEQIAIFPSVLTDAECQSLTA